jgi:hypothetical protein
MHRDVATTKSRSSHLNHGSGSVYEEDSDQPPPSRQITLSSSSSTRQTSSSGDFYEHQSRPRTAPSQSDTSPASNSATFEPPIPRIAIFTDALSLKKLREQYQTIRKSPTLPDLSHTNLKRPQSRRINSASATTNVTAGTTPQLPELNFDTKAAIRRAPASRSSHGVDTGKGPPPAIVTRSSYTSDAGRRAQNPAAAAFAQQRDKPYNLRSPTSESFRHTSNLFDGLSSRDTLSDAPFSPLSPTAISPDHNRSLDAMMDQRSNYSDAQEYLDERASKHAGGLAPGQGAEGVETEGSGRSTEDLFLNLAQDSPAPSGGYDASGNLERRPVSTNAFTMSYEARNAVY